MLFTYLYYVDGLLQMKTFTKEQKDEALQWHRKHPDAVSLIGSTPAPEDFDLWFLQEGK